tara:strand:+ start:408 stop:983 length:576 start_codon:yes stop_codon:yes gene_type:complete
MSEPERPDQPASEPEQPAPIKAGSYRGPGRRSTDAQVQSERIFLVVVDSSEEMSVALRFACRRAQHTGGRVALLYVMEPADFQHFASVGELMREENRQEAERTLQTFAEEVNGLIGVTPTLYVREGVPSDEILKLIEEEPNISILVLGAGTDKKGPGPLVTSLAGKLAGKFPIPITVVPGTLSLERIDALT